MEHLNELPERGRSSSLADPLSFLAMLLAVAIWGVNYVVIKDAVHRWPVFPFLALRFSIATVCIVPLVLHERHRRQREARGTSWKVTRYGGLAGAALFGAYATQTYGIRATPTSTAAFLTSLYLVFVPLFLLVARRGNRRPATAYEWGGALLALAGVLSFNVNVAPGTALGSLLLIACAMCYALQVLIVGASGHRVAPVLFTAMQLFVVAGGATLFAIPELTLGELPTITTPIVLDALFTGLVASTLAYLLQTWGQRRLSTTQAAVLLGLEPLFATVTAWALLSEAPSTGAFLGAAFICVGIAISQISRITLSA